MEPDKTEAPTLGAMIKAGREALSMTREELGATVGRRHWTVAAWERDTATPPSKVLSKIVARLGLDPASALMAAGRAS